MQDISRDDFSILNGGDAHAHTTEKDMCPTLIYRVHDSSPVISTATNLPKQLNNEDNEIQSFAAVKLEDINTIDIFSSPSSSWRQHPMNSNHELFHNRMFVNAHNHFDSNNTKLLLQGSDDPLISHGANNVLSNDDEHPADFAKSLMSPANNHIPHTLNKQDNEEALSKLPNQQPAPQRPVKSGCSNLTKQQLKVKANLMSAKNQQQKIQNTSTSINISVNAAISSQKQQRAQKAKNKKGTTVKLRFHHQALPPEYLSHYEATQGQLKICKNQSKFSTLNPRSISKSTTNHQKQTHPRNSHENVRSWLQKIAEIQRTANASRDSAIQSQKPSETHQTEPANHNTCDQKQGTVRISKDANNNSETKNVHQIGHHTSSLTQSVSHESHFITNVNNSSNSKRNYYPDLPFMGEITLDNCKPRRGRKPKKADICHLIYKNYGTVLPKQNKFEICPNNSSGTFNMETQGNKIEEWEQPLNLCLRDQLFDSYSISSGDELSETNSSCATPISNPLDYVRDSMLANNLKKSLNNIDEQNSDKNVLNTSTKHSTLLSKEKVIHPITMYYQKLLESGLLLHNANGPFKTIQKDNQLALKIPIPSGLLVSQKFEKSTSSPAVSNIEYPEPMSTPSSVKSENSLVTATSCTVNNLSIVPQKRKRSAIFIPPMNVENTTNPATEVSICKFKFTGGSKPTLQEKKMVSVDAGGNYRYFSGTGDKASRGYEYFPRESLQQTAGLLPGINCAGQKLSVDIPPPSAGLSNDLLQISETPASSVLFSGRSVNDNSIVDSVSLKSTITHYESNNIIDKQLCGRT